MAGESNVGAASDEASRALAERPSVVPPGAAADVLLVEAPAWRLHRDYPAYASACVAAEAGWPADDVVPLIVLERDHGLTRAIVKRGARAGAGVVQDAWGLRYTRRSRFARTDAEYFARALERDPALAALDPQYWVPFHEALAQLPGVPRHTLLQDAPVAAVRLHRRRVGPEFVHLSPAVRARFERVPLAAAVARLAAEREVVLNPDDFIPQSALAAAFTARGLSCSLPGITAAVARGRVLQVRAIPSGSSGGPAYHVYAPQAVRGTHDPAVVMAWRRGGHPPPAARRTGGRAVGAPADE